jgi:DNA-directed RNA polymerase specialized sigma24 family protein
LTPGGEDEFARNMLVMDLKRSLRNLYEETPTQKCSEDIRALLQTAIAGRSYDECAAELGIAVPALKTRVHRLRKRMEPRLKAYIRRNFSGGHGDQVVTRGKKFAETCGPKIERLDL